MTLKFKNNAQTTLSAGIDASVTSIGVVDGSVFPTLTGIEYFYATFEDVSLNREVVKVTARSGNTLTVVRAQDGTTARAFSIGDKAEGRLVAAMLTDLSAPSYILSALLTVDGATSGLDADLLDGLSSAAYAQLAAANVFTATQTINSNSAAAPSPGTTGVALHLNGADGVSTRLWLDSFGIGTNYTARRANGTNAAKTTLIGGDVIMNNTAFGYDGTAYSTGAQAAFQIAASQTWAVGAHGTRMIFQLVPDNSITLTPRWVMEQDGSLMYSGATATGAGTVNALNYFVAGTNISSIYQTIAGYTAADVLSKLLTVDGAGSGLDADLLDGNSSAYYQAASGYTAADVLSKLLTVDGAGSALDADLLDGLNSAAFGQLAAANTWTGASNVFNYGASGVSQVLLGGANAQGAYLYLRANAGQTRGVVYQTGAGTNRWQMYVDTVAEGGSNAGSNYHLRAYDDAGASLGDVFNVPRNTLVTAFTNTPTVGANTIWHAGNDGTGSGLDADLWDGNNFATYLNQAVLTSSAPTFAGATLTAGLAITSTAPSMVLLENDQGTDLKRWDFLATGGTLLFRMVNDANSLATSLVTITRTSTYTAATWNYASTTTLQHNSNTIWHAGNDGAGSGLDADLWDGNQFATYIDQALLTTSTPRFSWIHIGTDTDLRIYESATNVMTLRAGGVGTETYLTIGVSNSLQVGGFTIYHTANDGAGSGLDADLWDGNNFATYLNQALLTTSTPTFGGLTLTSATGFLPQINITNTNDDANAGYVILRKSPADTLVSASDYIGTILWYGRGSSSTDGTAATVYARAEGTRGTNWVASDLVLGSISTAGSYRYLMLNAVGTMTWNSSTVWTAANDGAGSGLDADTLDGSNIGTSGATIPLLNANNTYSGISAFTGQVTMSRGAVPLQITTTVDNGNVQGMIIEGDRATPSANDIVYMDWRLSNSAGTQTEFGRQSIVASTVTAASEASYWMWAVRAAGTLTNVAILTSSAFSPNTSDGIGLGSTAQMWSDLFLASGGVVNFNNGDVTITHSANTLAFAGASSGYTFDAPLTLSSTVAGNPLVITSTEAGAVAFTVDLFRDSASPAASDALAALRFRGRNSTPATVTYSSIQSTITDPTAASEDANLFLQTMMAGTLTNALTVGFNAVQHRFTGPTDLIVSSVGANGYGAFYAIGSGTNASYIFLGNGTSGERGRIWATDTATLMLSTNGGVTAHLAISSAGAVTASSNTVWHAGNDGAGSGLDADTLDGINSGGFMILANQGQRLVTTAGIDVSGGTAPSSVANSALEIFQATAGADAFFTFHIGSDYAVHFGLDGGTNDLFVGGWSMGTSTANKIWHAGNDGAGSGLDADTVDGNNIGTSGTAIPLLSGTNTWGGVQTFSRINAAAAGSGFGGTIQANCTDSYVIKMYFSDNGTARGYYGADATDMFKIYDSGGNLRVQFNASTYALTLNGVAVPTISSTDTLTNKTLTSPTINGGTIQSRVQTSSETTGTLTVASANKTLALTGGVTMPNAVFTAGDMITMDPGTSARTITRGASVTMYVNGVDSATATLAANQMGGAYWRSSSVCVLTGAVT